MCLYPRLIKNPKYKITKKNGGNVPVLRDPRMAYVPIGCGKCMECMKKRATGWNVRLCEEIKTDNTGKFVTLTFSTESLRELAGAVEGRPEGYELDNAIATLAVRRFLERWRAKHKKSVRHWLVTELGQTRTEHMHIHGIIFTNETKDIGNIWKYGHVWIGTYVNERSIGYITKYLTKADLKHREYKPIILASAGIGGNYANTPNAKKLNAFNGEKTDERYVLRNGRRTGIPIYLRNKLYTEEQREELWIHKLNQQIRWVGGTKIDVSQEKGWDNYFKILKMARLKNKQLGYGDDASNWRQETYEKERRNLIMKERIGEREEKEGQRIRKRKAKRKNVGDA